MDDLLAQAARHEQLGQLREAADAYARAASEAARQASEALIRKALLKSAAGDLRAAMADLERAEAVDPTNPYPRMRLAHLTAGMGRRWISVSHLRAACRIEPWNTEMKVNLGSAYLQADWRDLAFSLSRSLPEDVADWWAQVRQFGLDWYRESRGEALALLRARDRTGKANHGQLYEIARMLFRTGRLRVAERICRSIIGENPGWFLPFWLLADIQGRRFGADAALAEVARYDLSDDLPDYARADALEAETTYLNEAGRYDALIARLDREPGVERREHVRYIAAVAAFMTGRDAELKDHCRRWMERSPLASGLAGFLVLMHARDNAGREAMARVEPRAQTLHLAQFWNTAEPPAEVVETMGSWTRQNPGLTRTLFDEAAARTFMAEHFGAETGEAFALCYHPAMMADVFRIALLQVRGGLYADADEACVRPLGDLLPDLERYDVVAARSDGAPGFVDTPFLGSRRNSRVMRLVLEDTVSNIRKAAHEGRRPLIWETTGPGALTRGVARHLTDGRDGGADVFLLPIQQLRAFVQTRDLRYKSDPQMNWRIATG